MIAVHVNSVIPLCVPSLLIIDGEALGFISISLLDHVVL